eukprot:gene9890-biopygen2898
MQRRTLQSHPPTHLGTSWQPLQGDSLGLPGSTNHIVQMADAQKSPANFSYLACCKATEGYRGGVFGL